MVIIFDSNYDYQLWDDADILGIIHIPKVLKKSTPNEKSVDQRIANTIRAINNPDQAVDRTWRPFGAP